MAEPTKMETDTGAATAALVASEPTSTPAPEAPASGRRAGVAPVKKEFLKPRPSAEEVAAAKTTSADALGNAETRDARDNGNNGGKRRGTFKKRPVDAEADPADMLCRPVAAGEGCPFGDSCKFNHDLDDYMKRKPKDLAERCPVFEAFGYCRYGVACRFAQAHVVKTDGTYRNLRREEKQDTAAKAREDGEEMNSLTNEVRQLLRKNKYPFQSKQQGRKKDRRNQKGGNKDQQRQPEQPSEDAMSAVKEDKDAVKASEVTKPVKEERTATTETTPAKMEAEVKPETKQEVKAEEPMEPAAESPLLAERKPVDFKRKIYIAPLTTVGNLPFRRLMKQTGADITCGEMALATNLLKAQQSEWALLRRHASEDVFGVQLAGAHGDQMARVCELLARETDVDFVDINMGCPIDIVCRAGAGSALMTRPPRLLEVVAGALTGLELGARTRTGDLLGAPGLTVKLRTGWSEKAPTAHKLAPKLQAMRASSAYVNAAMVTADFKLRATQSLDAVTVHGRSRLQRYTKHADWDYVFQCSDAQKAETTRVPYVGGGDVLSYEEFDAHLQNGKLETCMLARGALIKPWLPTEIKERRHWDISASERLDLLKDFVRFGLEHWGSDQKGVNRTRRYLLEWQSFLCRYIPVGLLETLPQRINDRPAPYYGRSDLETLMASDQAVDWVKISEMLLGPVPDGFQFVPKHRANAYASN